MNNRNRIIYVEDDTDDIEFLQDAFSRHHHQLTIFPDGRELLLFLEHHAREVCLIILDINLPGPDGIKLMNDIKQSPYNHLPVVMFTNGANAPQIKALKGFGIEVIGKPDTEQDYDSIARTMLNYCLHSHTIV